MFLKKKLITLLSGSALAAAAFVYPVLAHDHTNDTAVIYVTRHAEKLTVEDENGVDVCAADRCEEALSPLGELRAELLASYFEEIGVLSEITHVFSSDKQRTRQTLVPTAAKVRAAGTALPDTADVMDDGVVQIPGADSAAEGNELTGNSKSVELMAQAILDLPAGSVAVVAAHSGTIYKIFGGEDTDGMAQKTGEFVGLGIDTTIGANQDGNTLFPKKPNGKVVDFGDLWKIVISKDTGEAKIDWRINLQPGGLEAS